MKIFRFITLGLIFAAFFAVSTAAQTTPAANKIGVIDTRFFLDGQNGIKKFVDAINTVNAEFKTAAAELDGTALKIQNLEKELKTFQDQVQKGVQVNEATVNAKLEEYDRLSREYKFKKEDTEARYKRRQGTLIDPVRRDIGNAVQEFAKKNGYVVIFDISKDEVGLILALGEKTDVTKEFIAFYNARPAPTAVK